MKAIRIHSYGGPEVLRLEEIPRPAPGPGELLIKVHAASVNPVDWNVRQGHMQQFLPLKLPAVLGWDLSGKVEAIGTGVGKLPSPRKQRRQPSPERLTTSTRQRSASRD
jgi:NADPH:quinone reductase-like Zn-dependent oxidoreductase